MNWNDSNASEPAAGSWAREADDRRSKAEKLRRRRLAGRNRPLWASTGTKNPAYSDLLYVESLIGPHTINTMPPATLEAFRDHGKVALTVERGVEEAEAALARLESLGIRLDEITEQLVVDGEAAFAASFDKLIAALQEKRKLLVAKPSEGLARLEEGMLPKIPGGP